jgi:type I restriction enzyme S subunit
VTGLPRLDSVAQIVDCEHKTAPESKYGIPFAYSIGTPALRGANVDFKQAKPINEETYLAWTRRAVPVAGDLIFAREAPVGGVGFVKGDRRICLGQRTVLIRTDSKHLDSKFLFYALKSPLVQRWIQDRSTGSTVEHLNVADVRSLPLPFYPPLPEQKRIAAVLGALDDLIEIDQELEAICENLAVASVEASGSNARLSDFAEIAPTETRLPIARTDHYSLPAFDLGRMPQRIDASEIKSTKIILQEPVVLVSRLNPRTPRIWMVYPDLAVTCAASTEFVPVIGKQVSTEEVWALCSSEQFLSQMTRLVTGTTGSHQRVDKKLILSLNVPNISKIDSLKRTAIRSLVAQAQAARVEVQLLVRTRNELLPLLMSGRISVKAGSA